MSDKIYTVAIAGCGKRGKLYAEQFAKNPRFKVVGLSDPVKEAAEAASKLCGGGQIFDSSEAMLKATKPDIFSFCTPPTIRMPLIKQGVENGVKLIAYEKPMAASFNEAMEIRELVNKAGVKTIQSHQRKYNVQFQEAKKIVDSGACGRIHTVYAQCGGWFMHMATHLADYMRFFINEAEAEYVIGQVHGREKLTDNHPSPDYACAIVGFKGGIRGFMETGYLAPDVPEVDYWWRKVRVGVQGTDGFAEAFVGGGWRAVTKSTGAVGSNEGTWDGDHEQAPYINDIARWLDGEIANHPCNGEGGYKDEEIAMAMLRSAIFRKKIDLPMGKIDKGELEYLNEIIPQETPDKSVWDFLKK
jgi:predicted dehydrogenase